MIRIINIEGKETSLLSDTRFHLRLMSYEIYLNIGSPKLSFENTALRNISNEFVYPSDYFSFECSVDCFSHSTNFYVLKCLP